MLQNSSWPRISELKVLKYACPVNWVLFFTTVKIKLQEFMWLGLPKKMKWSLGIHQLLESKGKKWSPSFFHSIFILLKGIMKIEQLIAQLFRLYFMDSNEREAVFII